MIKKINWPKVRKWAYGILIAATPIAVAYELLTPAVAPLWLALGAAFLNVEKAPDAQG